MGDSKPATLKQGLHNIYSIGFKGKTRFLARSWSGLPAAAAKGFSDWLGHVGVVGCWARLGG
jgi:hypothetical protein